MPLSELAPNAPDEYTVKRGDTLWGISGLFLNSPWRWPELWGMNMEEVRNPHRIYPGQQLVLEKIGRPGPPAHAAGGRRRRRPTPSACRRAPASSRWPTRRCRRCKPHLIEPFLTEPVIVDEATLLQRAAHRGGARKTAC